jgi:divalent metal cation (Fe/Co/Zn/Cd) transporter
MKKYAAQLGRLSNEMNKQIGGKDILQQNDISLRKQLKGEQIHDVKNKLKQKITERVSIESAVQVC